MTFLQMIQVWWRLRWARPAGLSIDITDRCTLSCAGCYMKWYGANEDLAPARWEEIIQSFPASGRHFCAWTGGEPLLRAEDIRKLSRHFTWNWVATNGTVLIPDLPRTTVFVSVDGPEEVHDSLRGGWRELVRNVRPDSFLVCTVRRENSAPEILRENVAFWRERARGIVFGFLTPRRGSAHDSLAPDERAAVVRTLHGLRREFGSFVLGVPGQTSDSARTAWGQRCPVPAAFVALDARGERKTPCVLGSEADCARCGCAVPGFLRRVRRFDVRTLRQMSSLFRRGPAPRGGESQQGKT